jgi:hypothetical protein
MRIAIFLAASLIASASCGFKIAIHEHEQSCEFCVLLNEKTLCRALVVQITDKRIRPRFYSLNLMATNFPEAYP